MPTSRSTVADAPPRAHGRGGQPLSTEVFIERAMRKHGHRYDYSRVRYVDSRTPVDIVCSEHGAFSQTPNSHLYNGRGCPRCGRRSQVAAITRHDTAGFVNRARAIHGDRYGYDNAVYGGLNEKLTVTCSVHGDFQQAPNNHLYAKAGCPGCAVEAIKSKTSLSQADFEAAVRRAHGDRYGLELAHYAGAMRKVTLTCGRHGRFRIAPNGLLAGKGCRRCGYEKRQRTRSQFVAEATEVFEGRYEYDHVRSDRVSLRLRVDITCARHGLFTMPAGRHLLGAGCPGCSESRAERLIRRLLTDAGVDFTPQWGHPTLRHKMPLRFDFALPVTSTLIEFDGEFHHGPVRMPGQTPDKAEQVYRDTVVRDQVKDEWAAANGWRLIRLTDRISIENDLVEAGVLLGPTTEVSE